MKPIVPAMFAMFAAFAATSPARAEIVSQATNDVQILQAWTGATLMLDIAKCAGPIAAPGETVTTDCTTQGLDGSRAPWAHQDSPAANPWLLPVESLGGLAYSRYSTGNIVEIRALVKRVALSSPVFAGIGFFYTNLLGSGQTFIPAARLHIVSAVDVTLAGTGEQAAVLRFVLFMPGEAGDSGTGWSMDSVQFKPFAQFQSGAQTFQNWDPSGGNYRIYRADNGGGTPQIASFDRQDVLLQR